jgi:pyrroline-5-carboxylate reductase
VASAAVVVLAVKPQTIEPVLAELGQCIRRHQLVVSIAAGVRLSRIESALGAGARVVRVMPNTPSLVSRGAAVLCPGASARKSDLAAARAIFAAVGIVHVVEDEALMDAVTALSGSGPAYVYRFAEALIEAGRRCGLPETLVTDLTYHTIAGGAEMLIRTGETPGALREAVSSPGGTTLAGLAVLDRREFVDTVISAVQAAMLRSRELGNG